MSQLPVIFLMGPTAAGKTQLAMDLHDRLGCELVSVDSALIYRSMDIGTAKPSPQELQQYPHHLVDIRDPSESYSAAEFRQDALMHIAEIHQAGRIPVLVGGTMLYYHALANGLASLPEADAAVRERLLTEATEKGWPEMHRRLAEVDPESAERLNPNDAQRLQRALEVYEISGKTLTQHWAEQADQKPGFPIVSMAVMPQQRSELHARIAQRFHLMLEQGFVKEVEALYQRGDLDLQMPSVRCVGYRQAWEYLSGTVDYETMVDKGIIATRQLAKRQITWLRSWPDLNWLDTHDPNLCGNALKLMDSVII